jgi:hypothetical protein
MEVYLETFGGMFWCFFNMDLTKFPNLKQVVYNDFNHLNYNLFKCVQNPSELQRALDSVPVQQLGVENTPPEHKLRFYTFQSEIFGKDFTINCKDFPEAYENFSVDTFKVNFKPIGAYAYDQDNSGFFGDDYVITLIVDPTKIYKIDVSIINHEMKHAYQDFKRYENKSIGIKDSNFIKNMYTDDFGKFVVMFFNGRGQDDTLMKILYLYYIFSNVEQTAFLENIYDEGPNPKFFGYNVQVKSAMNLLNQLDITNLNEKTW